MAYTKTNWLDRAVQFATRYLKSGETSSGVTLTADPGTITQAGTPVNATNLNKLEQGVFDAHVTADAAVKRSGDTMTGKLNVSFGSLGPVSGNSLEIDERGGATSNTTTLITRLRRIFNGSSWDSAAVELVKKVDATYQQVISLDGNGNINLIPSGGFVQWGGLNMAQTRTTNGYVEWNNGGTWQGVGGVKNVQRGQTGDMPAGGVLDVTISAVNTSKSYISVNWGSFSVAYVGSAAQVRAYLINSTTLRFQNANATNGPLYAAWEVIESY